MAHGALSKSGKIPMRQRGSSLMGWIWIRSGLRTFSLSPLDLAVSLSILHPGLLLYQQVDLADVRCE
jgi:hypothetical protein